MRSVGVSPNRSRSTVRSTPSRSAHLRTSSASEGRFMYADLYASDPTYHMPRFQETDEAVPIHTVGFLFMRFLYRVFSRRFDCAEKRAVQRHGRETVGVKPRAAPLKLVAFPGQPFDALVNRHDPAHLFANGQAAFERKELVAVRHRSTADERGNFPVG